MTKTSKCHVDVVCVYLIKRKARSTEIFFNLVTKLLIKFSWLIRVAILQKYTDAENHLVDKYDFGTQLLSTFQNKAFDEMRY